MKMGVFVDFFNEENSGVTLEKNKKSLDAPFFPRSEIQNRDEKGYVMD